MKLGGDTPAEQTVALEQRHANDIINPHEGAAEVPAHREDLTKRDLANAPSAEPTFDLGEIPAEEADKLLKLQEAGMIDLPGLKKPEQDPRLVEWTYEELAEYLLIERPQRRLKPGTVETTEDYLRFLANGPRRRWTQEIPPPPTMSLRPPREKGWLAIVRHYLEYGKDGKTLNNHRLSLKRLLEFLGIPEWESLKTNFPEPFVKPAIPPDKLVPEFWKPDTERSSDPYMNAMWRAVFHFTFHAGLRPPSELADLELPNVDFERDRITYYEKKKDNWRYDVPFEPFMVSATNGPSLRWYVEHVRPEVDVGKSDALFLTKKGEAWSHRYFGKCMSEVGKRVWPKFTPYSTRHWFATQFLIANDFRVYPTAKRIGDTVSVTEKWYLDEARARSEMDRKFRMPRFRRMSQ